jgi:hypothetical protein
MSRFTLPSIPNARTFSIDACDAVRKVQKQARDHFVLFDSSSDFVAACDVSGSAHAGVKAQTDGSRSDWFGNVNGAETMVRMARDGDMSAVAASDRFLAKFDAVDIPSARRQWVDDVAGPVPNVPAFLANAPLAMRRRKRSEDETAPLTVVVDIASSGGIDASDVRQRGIAILALVRALASVRPVTLYVGTTLGNYGGAGLMPEADGSHIYFRIDTAPLDLVRAAHLISHPCVSRGLLYGAHIGYMNRCNKNIPWAYQNADLFRKNIRDVFAPAFEGDVLALPSIHVRDRSVTEPVAWVREMLALHSKPEGYVDVEQEAA